jgi:hypothetical protein
MTIREVDQAAGQTCEDVLGDEPGLALLRVAWGQWWPIWWARPAAIALTDAPMTKARARRVIKQQAKLWSDKCAK